MVDPLFFVQIAKFKMRVLIIIFVFFYYFQALSQELFIEGLGDIPIYKKMEYLEDSLILFDKIDGRYVSTKTKGNYSQKEVQEFYAKALPNLGWTSRKKNFFEREDELLEIKFFNEEDKTIAIFKIFPK